MYAPVGSGQVVRQRVLVPSFGGSSPSSPAKLEKKSILSPARAAEPCRLSPNACAGKPALAPPEKPFALFFEFPPAEISFLVVKGVFWWFDCRTWQRRWGFAQAAEPPRYAPSPGKFSFFLVGLPTSKNTENTLYLVYIHQI